VFVREGWEEENKKYKGKRKHNEDSGLRGRNLQVYIQLRRPEPNRPSPYPRPLLPRAPQPAIIISSERNNLPPPTPPQPTAPFRFNSQQTAGEQVDEEIEVIKNGKSDK
jgi:hypothetical protein